MSNYKLVKLGDVLKYEQPTKYIVSNDMYNDSYSTPVLTAGKTFLLGYTNETENIFTKTPVIIFDDFTTAIKYVDFPFKVKSSAMKILNPTDDIDIKYMFYLMSTIKSDKGLHKRYWISKYANIKINLPTLDQQKQIAKTLDKANKLIELRTESIKKLDALAKSIFIDMFGDPLSNSKKWKIKRIADLGKVQTGNTPPRADLDNYGNFIEWIKSDNILKDNIIVAKSREYLSEKGYSKGRIVKSGSLLFTCIAGSMSSIGNLAITDREVTFNQQINSLTPFENNELYLYSLFKLSKKFFEENSTKSMKIMINKSTFENLLFPIAPLALQNKFAKIIEKIEEQKTLYTQELEKLQTNFDALLQKSFQE